MNNRDNEQDQTLPKRRGQFLIFFGVLIGVFYMLTCPDSEVFNKPIESEEGYLIFISDEFFIPINLTNENGNVVTVSGYAECLHYQDGGYLHSQSAAWGKTTQPINQLIGIISIISILVFTSHRKIDSHE